MQWATPREAEQSPYGLPYGSSFGEIENRDYSFLSALLRTRRD